MGGQAGTHEHKNVWTGFAGVAQTTVERLLREGGARDEDATAAPLADKLATLQHIMGGECTRKGSSTEYRAAVGRLSDATGAICRKLRRAGGVGTDLWDTVTRADAYIKAHTPTDAHGWDALRDMLACNVPNPRWAVPGGLTPKEEREHNKLLDASITKEWGELLNAAEEVRICWRDMTRAVVTARERMDSGRGMLRLVIRAWRETADGIRAGAAKWDQRWAASEMGNPLARRLQFNDTVSHYGTEAGWRMRAVLTWMRLVRAEKVQRARRRSSTWRADEQRRLHQIYENGRAAPLTMHTRRPYTWREQTEISSDTGATSGAAAVILKRRRAAACMHRDAPADKKQKAAVDDDESARHTRERRVDSQLIYTTNAHRLYIDRITYFWRWQPRTGDG